MSKDIYSLAKLLGAKNITNSPFANSIQGRQYLNQRADSQTAEQNLQSMQTPLGAVSGGIALYLQKKRENKALEELNTQMQAEDVARIEKRQSLVNTLPEQDRQMANFLDDAKLQDYVVGRLKPVSEEDKLTLENRRLQNAKLQKDINTQGESGFGKPPAGYNFKQDGSLEAIAGGPASKQSAESAGKIALIKQGLSDVSSLEKSLMNKDGSFDKTKIAQMRTYGRLGARDEYSKLNNALNARLRLESGAAVPESEVTRAFDTFAPSPLDSDATIKSKIDRMKGFFDSATQEIGQGRGADPIKPQQTGTFESSNGVKFTIKR